MAFATDERMKGEMEKQEKLGTAITIKANVCTDEIFVQRLSYLYNIFLPPTRVPEL